MKLIRGKVRTKTGRGSPVKRERDVREFLDKG